MLICLPAPRRTPRTAILLTGLAAALVMAGCETVGGPSASVPDLSVDNYASALTVREETSYTAISSRLANPTGSPQYSEASSDSFLISEIDNETGDAGYFVFTTFSRRSPDWPTPNRATFGEPKQTVDFERLDGSINCGDAGDETSKNCLRIESGAFEVPRAELEQAVQSGAATWPFTIKSRSSHDLNSSLPVNEIRAVLAAADNVAAQ